MDFLFYLTPIGREIVSSIMLKNFQVKENIPICKKYKDLFGYTQSPNFVICTNNIKNNISPVSYYVNETVLHEAVHVIQSCKRGSIGINNIILSSEKLNDVVRSVNYGTSASIYEIESYYLEDKPELVLEYLKKYCF